jgi:hypothetical protein
LLNYPSVGQLQASLISRDIRELAQMQLNLSLKNGYAIIEVRGTNSMCAYSTNSRKEISALIVGLKKIKKAMK